MIKEQNCFIKIPIKPSIEMKHWQHKHILTLANFAREDYEMVFELATHFKSLNVKKANKLTALQGYLVTTLFFEASTRTKNSFELASKKLSADVQSFSPSSSSLSKGESYLDTALTYSAMGSNILVIRHSSGNVPAEIAHKLDLINSDTSVLNAGNGNQSHPSQGLLDLYTLSNFFSPNEINPSILKDKSILIVGDIIHSRVARSNIWALTAFGANIILCGPSALVPKEFKNFIKSNSLNHIKDPIKNRGKISIARSLKSAIKTVDAVIVLRLQKERMEENILNSIKSYSNEFCLTPELIDSNKANIPILHPGPINRDVEISSKIVDEYSNCLINTQVANGVPIRMALLYLISNINKKNIKAI